MKSSQSILDEEQERIDRALELARTKLYAKIVISAGMGLTIAVLLALFRTTHEFKFLGFLMVFGAASLATMGIIAVD